MFNVIKYPATILLLALVIGSIYFIEAQIPSNKTKDTKIESPECDLKNKSKLAWCPGCKEFLIRFKCKTCEQNKCQKCHHYFQVSLAPAYIVKDINSQIKSSPTYMVKDIKCPCCAEAGTSDVFNNENLTEVPWQKNDKCLVCHQAIEMKTEEYCVKKAYACPDHPDYKDIEPGKCQEKITDSKGKETLCEKKLVLQETVYSEIVSFFVCPKCGEKYNEKGKCVSCKETLKEKKLCNDSGSFPHVNGLKWSEILKKRLNPEPEKTLSKQDELVSTSQPEVVIFEGTRQPMLKSWTYLLYCPKTKEAVLVDASCGVEELSPYIEEQKLKLKYIFISHGHFDHFVTQAQIQRKYRDAKVLRFGSLKNNDYVKLGELTLKIFHTPGHAADCIVIWSGKMLFTGDSFDVKEGFEKTRTSLPIRGEFTIYGGHASWQQTIYD